MAEKKKNDKVMKTGGGKNRQLPNKVTAPIKKKIKEFANRKTKEYRDDERKFQKKMYDPMSTEKKSALDYIKMHPIFSSRTSAATELNKLINTKEERKAAGLDYKVGGVVKDYSLSADDKRRRKAFKSGAGKGRNNTGMKKIKMKEGGAVHTMPDGTKMKGAKHGMKHGGMVIVDRNYLKGK